MSTRGRQLLTNWSWELVVKGERGTEEVRGQKEAYT